LLMVVMETIAKHRASQYLSSFFAAPTLLCHRVLFSNKPFGRTASFTTPESRFGLHHRGDALLGILFTFAALETLQLMLGWRPQVAPLLATITPGEEREGKVQQDEEEDGS
ncbi:hypothetical protein XENOCAPTIV_012252, partial [Xenoophorus captivus]